MNISTYTVGSRFYGFNRTYEVKNETQQIIYLAQKKLFSRTFILRDLVANDVSNIRRKQQMFQRVFEIFNENWSGEFSKQALKRDSRIFTSEGEWILKGRWKSRSFELFDPKGMAAAKISRKRFRRIDQYGLAIIEGYDELFIISSIIALDWMIRLKKAAASGG